MAYTRTHDRTISGCSRESLPRAGTAGFAAGPRRRGVAGPARVITAEGESLPAPALEEARQALSTHYGEELGEPFRTAGLCLYRDGRDSVAWHGDTTGRGSREDTMVGIVALGGPGALTVRA